VPEMLSEMFQRIWRDMDQGHKLPDWTVDIPEDWDEEDEE
jgi:hypothetical protein